MLKEKHAGWKRIDHTQACLHRRVMWLLYAFKLQGKLEKNCGDFLQVFLPATFACEDAGRILGNVEVVITTNPSRGPFYQHFDLPISSRGRRVGGRNRVSNHQPAPGICLGTRGTDGADMRTVFFCEELTVDQVNISTSISLSLKLNITNCIHQLLE